MSKLLIPKTMYNIHPLLHERGRIFYLHTRAKAMRHFNISASTWHLWMHLPYSAHWRNDIPAQVLHFIAKELELPVERLINKTVYIDE